MAMLRGLWKKLTARLIFFLIVAALVLPFWVFNFENYLQEKGLHRLLIENEGVMIDALKWMLAIVTSDITLGVFIGGLVASFSGPTWNWTRGMYRRARGQRIPPPPETGVFSHDQQARAKATPIIDAELDIGALSKINARLIVRFVIFNGNPNITDITGFTGGIRVLGEDLPPNISLVADSNSREASEFFHFSVQALLTKEMAELVRSAIRESNHLSVKFRDARFHMRMRIPRHPSGVPYAIKIPGSISFDCRNRGKPQPSLLVTQELLWSETLPPHPKSAEPADTPSPSST